MAAYGTLVAWARALGHDEAADLLQQTLDEEKAADEKLSSLAEGGINEEAAGAGADDDDEDMADAPSSPSKLKRAATPRKTNGASARAARARS
jgi:hypothetical protein